VEPVPLTLTNRRQGDQSRTRHVRSKWDAECGLGSPKIRQGLAHPEGAERAVQTLAIGGVDKLVKALNAA